MSLKKRLVDGDVLEPHNPFSFFDLENPIDEQKRIAMRQHLHDIFNSKHRSFPYGVLQQCAHQCNGTAVTWFVSSDSSAHTRRCQAKIANDIQRLVSHEFIGPAQRSINGLMIVQHHRVLR